MPDFISGPKMTPFFGKNSLSKGDGWKNTLPGTWALKNLPRPIGSSNAKGTVFLLQKKRSTKMYQRKSCVYAWLISCMFISISLSFLYFGRLHQRLSTTRSSFSSDAIIAIQQWKWNGLSSNQKPTATSQRNSRYGFSMRF